MPPLSSPPDVMVPPTSSSNVAGSHTDRPLQATPVPLAPANSLASYVFWFILLGLVAGGWYYFPTWWPTVAPYVGLEVKMAPAQQARIIPVVTTTVQKKNLEVFINGQGTVTAFKTVTIRSRVEGELVNVAFAEGQMVKEGDLLAEIDRRPFKETLDQYEGQLVQHEAALKPAELTLNRYQELLQKGGIEAQKVDEQRGLVKQTIGSIQTDRALIGNAKLQLDFCRIIAPISGRIGLRLVDQGNIVRANDLTGLAVITQLQPIALVFPIPQDDISRVQKALVDGRELIVLAYDRNMETKIATGKLASIDNQVDLTSGTVRLKAVFDNEDGLLFPNQFVNARLLIDTKKDSVVVPSAAVQRGPSMTFVYVVQPDESLDSQKVDLRTVQTGITEGSEKEILSGLEPGEIVVTEGLDKLTKDSRVSITSKVKEKKFESPTKPSINNSGKSLGNKQESNGPSDQKGPK